MLGSSQSCLTRMFIARNLSKYFASRDVVISAAAQPIPFTSLLNQWEYRNVVAKKYASSPTGWMTPVEVFQPHYSYAIARYIATQWKATGNSQPLVLYEIGGGNGTHARHVLDWIQRHEPAAYAACTYTLLEFSGRLREAQAVAVAPHSSHVLILAADALHLDSASLPPDPRPCFVMGLEVLDNLPHDKVARCGAGWQEACIVDASAKSGLLSEDFRPVSDPLIREVLNVAEGMGHPALVAPLPALPSVRGRLVYSARAWASSLLSKTGQPDLASLPVPPQAALHATFLPTGALAMLRGLTSQLPRHRLILADFDALPPPVVRAETLQSDLRVATYCPAHCSPLTASKDATSRASIDHLTYLHARPGIADIFFPTDFPLLAELVRHSRAGSKVPVQAAATGSHSGTGTESVTGTGTGSSKRRGRGDAPGSAAGSANSAPSQAAQVVGKLPSCATGTGTQPAPSRRSRADDVAVEVLSSAQFFRRYADVAQTRTVTGYNPLLEDYVNTRILLT